MNTSVRAAVAMSACAVAVMTVSACGGSPSGDDDSIRVGAILSLSGGGAVFGEAERHSMELAVDQINDDGGIDGRQIDLIVEDDKSEPSEAVTVVRDLISSEQVDAIFGASSGSSTLALLPVAQSSHIPVLSPNSTIEVVDEFPEGVFRTTPVDTAVVDGTLDYLKKNGLNGIGLLTESAAFGAQAGDALESAAADKGMTVVGREEYDPSATDLKPEITKLRSENPSVVIVWGTGPAPSIAFKNMDEVGMGDVPRLAPLGVATKENIELADGAMDGVLIPGVIDARQPANDAEKTFVDAYRKKYDELPTTLDAIAWDPPFIYEKAVEDAGSSEPADVQDALDDLCHFQGVVGDYCYADSHDGIGAEAVTMVQIKGTDFVTPQL